MVQGYPQKNSGSSGGRCSTCKALRTFVRQPILVPYKKDML